MIAEETSIQEVCGLLYETKVEESVASERVFTRRDYPAFITLSVINLVVIGLVMAHWFSPSHIWPSPVIFSILTLLFLIKLGINQGRWYILPLMIKPLPIVSRPGWRVGVATTVVPSAEPLAMLERTVRALLALEYPHDTWVLDEGDDDQVKDLCRKLGVKHFSRRGIERYQTESGPYQSASKHGNYNAWFTEVGFDTYDIIAAFDADHVPEPGLLLQVLGYFNDSTVGYVQLPQAYYNKSSSLVAHGAAEETYAYHACTQPTAFALGHPIIIGGHSTHRTAALKQIGGFGAHAADDLLTTLMYRERGWRGIYVPKVLARGLTPADWNTYLVQQLRWAKSVLDIKLNHFSKHAYNLPRKERWARFLHGLNFVEGGITNFLFLLLLAVMLVTGQSPGVVSFATFSVLLSLVVVSLGCEFFRQRFYLEPETERGVPWRAILIRYAKWPFLFWAYCTVIKGGPIRYTLTLKSPTPKRNLLLFWPHAAVIVVISVCWTVGIITRANNNPALHFLASVIVFGSAGLILTEFRQPSSSDPRPGSPNGSCDQTTYDIHQPK